MHHARYVSGHGCCCPDASHAAPSQNRLRRSRSPPAPASLRSPYPSSTSPPGLRHHPGRDRSNCAPAARALHERGAPAPRPATPSLTRSNSKGGYLVEEEQLDVSTLSARNLLPPARIVEIELPSRPGASSSRRPSAPSETAPSSIFFHRNVRMRIRRPVALDGDGAERQSQGRQRWRDDSLHGLRTRAEFALVGLEMDED
eukprot:tig00000178_g12743.t1